MIGLNYVHLSNIFYCQRVIVQLMLIFLFFCNKKNKIVLSWLNSITITLKRKGMEGKVFLWRTYSNVRLRKFVRLAGMEPVNVLLVRSLIFAQRNCTLRNAFSLFLFFFWIKKIKKGLNPKTGSNWDRLTGGSDSATVSGCQVSTRSIYCLRGTWFLRNGILPLELSRAYAIIYTYRITNHCFNIQSLEML